MYNDIRMDYELQSIATILSDNEYSRKSGGCWTAWIPKNATELQEKEFFGITLFHPGMAAECTAGVS